MNRTALLFLALMFALLSRGVFGGDVWLPKPPSFPQKEWQRLPANLYLDLGDDPEALDRLKSDNFVLDVPEVNKSIALTCRAPYKKYLIRSFYLGSPTARIYKTSTGLVVSVGAFSDPRSAEKGAIAICLTDDPGTIEGTLSFLK